MTSITTRKITNKARFQKKMLSFYSLIHFDSLCLITIQLESVYQVGSLSFVRSELFANNDFIKVRKRHLHSIEVNFVKDNDILDLNVRQFNTHVDHNRAYFLELIFCYSKEAY